ncbi:hypothetical protein MNV49_005852 [Pseudohyphozyma bogoriensis]|nr:hypothetical protein MNV49_005852 [Pseudohyphozyma bogoriensis]
MAGPVGAVDDIVTLMFILAGVKFSCHPVVLGPATRECFPKDIQLLTTSAAETHDVARYGLTRHHSVVNLSNRIWGHLESLIAPPASHCSKRNTPLSPAAIAKLVAAIHLAAKCCDYPMDFEMRRKIRRVCGWGATEAVKILDRPIDEVRKEGVDRTLLEKSVCQLAARECCDSLALGVPSGISDYTYIRATKATPSPSLPPISTLDLSPFFDTSVPIDCSTRADFFRFHVIPILRPVMNLTSLLHRDFSLKMPTPLVVTALPQWWETMDRLYSFFDGLSEVVLADSRYEVEESRKRAAMLLRAIYTAEECVVQLQVASHKRLEQVVVQGGAFGDEVLELLIRSKKRMMSVLARIANRMGWIMSEKASVLDVFHPISSFVRNLSLLEDSVTRCISFLKCHEIKAISQGAQFAAFWDASAASLNNLMGKLDLNDDRTGVDEDAYDALCRAEATAAFMVGKAMRETQGLHGDECSE